MERKLKQHEANRKKQRQRGRLFSRGSRASLAALFPGLVTCKVAPVESGSVIRFSGIKASSCTGHADLGLT